MGVESVIVQAGYAAEEGGLYDMGKGKLWMNSHLFKARGMQHCSAKLILNRIAE